MLLTRLSATLKHVALFNPEATYVVRREITQASCMFTGHAEPNLGKGRYMAFNHARSSGTMGWKTQAFCQRCRVESFRGLHKLTGVVRNISKISPKSLNLTVFCLFWSYVSEGMQSAVMQSIVLLNFSIVLSGPAWLSYLAGCCTSNLPLKMAIFRDLLGNVVL